jgi:hypothetical protein
MCVLRNCVCVFLRCVVCSRGVLYVLKVYLYV